MLGFRPAVGIRFMLRHQDRMILLEDDAELVAGRAADCAVCIDDLRVSRRHAVFRTKPDGAYVEDLGSRNGILVNGNEAPGETKLRHGDRITIGAHTVQLLDAARERQKTMPRIQPARGDETVPVAIQNVSPHATATTQTSRDVFGMLFDVADKAFASGRVADAESAVQYLQGGLSEALRKGKPVDEATLARAGAYLLRCAEETQDGAWVDRLLELYGAAERVPSGEMIDRITHAIPRVRATSGVVMRSYISAMLARPLPPADRVRLKRLEVLGT